MAKKEEGIGDRPHKFNMELNYLLVAVENNASTLMTNNIHHFIGSLNPIKNRAVKGYGGVIKVRGEGRVKWKIECYDGKIHSIIIQKVNYFPEAPIYLLSPQQWDQKEAENDPKTDGTW